MKINWLDRQITPAAPYLTLCLSEEQFNLAVNEIPTTCTNRWVTNRFDATVHYLRNKEDSLVTIICLDLKGKIRSGIEIASILVHESVHIWQKYCEEIGEDEPGSEQEAYAIQFISHTLMTEFVRQTNENRLQAKTQTR